MFNKEREQEPMDGTLAGAPDDEDRATYEGMPEADVESQEEPTNYDQDGAAVKYVGGAGSYTDTETKTRFKKGVVTSVSEADAERLTSLRGGTLFVRADS